MGCHFLQMISITMFLPKICHVIEADTTNFKGANLTAISNKGILLVQLIGLHKEVSPRGQTWVIRREGMPTEVILRGG